MRTSGETTKLIAALLAARLAFGPVIRAALGQVGQNRSYKYADLAGILDAIMPALLAHDLVIFQAVDAETATLITRLAHVSGEWVEASYPLKLDQVPQAFGSSLTYAGRYSIQRLLCLAAEDDDGAAAQPSPAKKVKGAATAPPAIGPGPWVTPPQLKRMFAIATAAGWGTDQMKEHLRLKFGIDSSKDLPASKYDEACADFEAAPVAHADQPF
jgi:hypothetical protein